MPLTQDELQKLKSVGYNPEEPRHFFADVDKNLEAYRAGYKEQQGIGMSSLRKKEDLVRSLGINPQNFDEIQQYNQAFGGLSSSVNKETGGLQYDTLSRIGEKFGVQPKQQSQLQSPYVRQETLKDGTVVGYLPDNNWEVISYPQKGKTGQQPIQPVKDEAKLGQIQGMFDQVAMAKTDLPVSRSSSLMETFRDLLKGSQPSKPSSADRFKQYQSQSLDPLENEYQTARTGLTEFENTLLNEADKIKGEPVSSTVINRKLVKLDADTANQLRQKQQEVQSVQSRLENKQKTVQMMMQYEQQDYQNAQQNYQFEYNKAFQIYSALKGEEDKTRDDARANLQVIQSMIKDKPNAFQEMDFSQKNYINNLELQSGLPIGFTESFITTKPNAKILFHTTNNGITQVFYDDPENPGQIGQVQTYGGGIDTGGIDTGEINSDILAYAQETASTGKLPAVADLKNSNISVSQVMQTAKELPKTTGTLVDVNTGIKPSTQSVSQERQEGLIGLYNAIDKSENLLELDKKRYGGVVSGTLGKVFGSKAQQDYISAREMIAKELQYALSGKAITQTEMDYFDSLLPGRFSEPLGFGVDSQDKINSFINNVSETLNNKLNGSGLVIYGFSKIGDYKVGDVIQNEQGQQGRVNADGSITLIK